MSPKIITGLLSAAAIILIVISYVMMKAGNNTAAIVFGVIGIILAVIYCVLSLPDVKKDIEKIKEKKKR